MIECTTNLLKHLRTMLACTHTTDLKKFKSGISTVFRTVQGRGKESAVTFESRLLFFHVHRDDVRVLKKRCGTDVSLSRAYMTLYGQ